MTPTEPSVAAHESRKSWGLFFSHLFALTAVWAAMVLPSALIHELRGEEGRFALAARDALMQGHWLLPEVLGEPYFNKPPLLPWMIAGTMYITGSESVWVVRLPTIVASYATSILVATTTRPLVGNIAALTAVVGFLSFPMTPSCRLRPKPTGCCCYSYSLHFFAGTKP